MKITPELYFFMYAHPAIGECANVSEREKSELDKLVLENKSPSKKRLESLVPAAFERMEQKLGKNYWTVDNIRKYWWMIHNQIIDNQEKGYENASMQHKEVCKVGFWKIVGIKHKLVILNNKQKTAKAVNYKNLALKSGDYITTHKGHVIEKITSKDYQKYG
jgi:hydrogenase maturation factor